MFTLPTVLKSRRRLVPRGIVSFYGTSVIGILMLAMHSAAFGQFDETITQIAAHAGNDVQIIRDHQVIWQSKPGQWKSVDPDNGQLQERLNESINKQKDQTIRQVLKSPRVIEATASDGQFAFKGPLLLSPDNASFIDVSISEKDNQRGRDQVATLNANVYSLPDGKLQQTIMLRQYQSNRFPGNDNLHVRLDRSGKRLFVIDLNSSQTFEREALDEPFILVKECSYSTVVLPSVAAEAGLLAYANWDQGDLVVWFVNAVSGEKLGNMRIEAPPGINGIASSPNGKYVAVSTGPRKQKDGDEKLTVWDVEAQSVCFELKGDLIGECQTFLNPRFSADSSVLLAYCRANLVTHGFAVPDGRRVHTSRPSREFLARDEQQPMAICYDSLEFVRSGRVSKIRLKRDSGALDDVFIDQSYGLSKSGGLVVHDLAKDEHFRTDSSNYTIAEANYHRSFGGQNIRNAHLVLRAEFKKRTFGGKTLEQRELFLFYDFSKLLTLTKLQREIETRSFAVRSFYTPQVQALSNDGQLHAVWERHGGLFCLPSGEMLGSLSQTPIWLANSPLGQHGLAGLPDGQVLYFGKNGETKTLQLSGSPTQVLGCDRFCKYLAFWSPNQSVQIMDLATETLQANVLPEPPNLNGICVSSDAQSIVYWNQGDLFLASANPTGATRRLPHGCQIVKADFSTDGRLAVVTTDGQVYLWSASTGQLLDQSTVPISSVPIGISCDQGERRVGVITDDFRLHWWEYCHWDQAQWVHNAPAGFDWSSANDQIHIRSNLIEIRIAESAPSTGDADESLVIVVTNRGDDDLRRVWASILALGGNLPLKPIMIGRVPAGESVRIEIPRPKMRAEHQASRWRISLHAENLDTTRHEILKIDGR